MGARAGIEPINVFDTRGAILDADFVPAKYRGLDRFDARKAIVADLAALAEENPIRGLDHIEDKKIMVPHDEKSKLVVIEPFLTDQWWVKADVLAEPALASVREGRTKFVPQQYENTYFAWLENIKPWCISRQLWWGHQIPAWYGPDGEAFVASDEARPRPPRPPTMARPWSCAATPTCSTPGSPRRCGRSRPWAGPTRRPNSSATIPPTCWSPASTSSFFWVARMMMMGLEFLDKEPFHTVYMHALVRDEKGQKMSKTKGNVIDPLKLVDEYGADATRFTLAAMAAQGRDLKLAISRVEGYRNFVTKLWNAARFLEMNEARRVDGYDPRANTLPLNRWIVGATARALAAVRTGIEDYKFNEAANTAYDFVWGTFCDWYVEFAKPVFMGEDEAAKAETRATAAWALDQILVMLHPMMPFVTEELWPRPQVRPGAREPPDPHPVAGPLRPRRCGRRCRARLAHRRHLQCPLGAGGDERAGRRQARPRGDRRRRGDAAAARGRDIAHHPPRAARADFAQERSARESAQFVVGDATYALPLAA